MSGSRISFTHKHLTILIFDFHYRPLIHRITCVLQAKSQTTLQSIC